MRKLDQLPQQRVKYRHSLTNIDMTTCGIFHGDESYPADRSGCLLANGHEGPHEFLADDGQRWLWETDLECDCEHCMRCEGDYCTVYWPKQYRATT